MLKLEGLFGRSKTHEDETIEYEPLTNHLYGTANKTTERCSKFGARAWGKILGLFHDMGKACQDFQQKIQGLDISVDHPAHGAQYIINKLGENNPIARVLSFVICGHHGGIPDALSGQGEGQHESLHQRLTKEIPHISTEHVREFDREFKKLKVSRLRLPKGAFRRFMFIKMLFSSLVDSDRLDAEKYGSPEKSALRGKYDSLSCLYKRLKKHLKNLAKEAEPTELNKLRAKVQKESLKAGFCWWDPRTWFRGFFTMTVPTGGAKTLASMAFALRHATRLGFKRVIYIIPYTSIIEQNAEEFRKILDPEPGPKRNVIEHHCNLDKDKVYGQGQSDDRAHQGLAAENWDAPVVITTNVQFFESLFNHKASRCRRLHNIINSVIVMDEAHLLPSRLLKPCVRALQELVKNYGCSVVFCTATQPGIMKSNGIGWGLKKAREIAKNPPELYRKLERVRIDFRPQIKYDNQLAHLLRGQTAVLCVLNLRQHARLMYEDIKDSGNVYHLSTLMCAAHRTKVIEEIKERLEHKLPCRVVSTQLVECGVCLDFPVVVRNWGSVASIVQSGGRCNREGKLPEGRLIVVMIPLTLGIKTKDDFQRQAEYIAKRYLEKGKNLLDSKVAEEAFCDLYRDLEDALDKPTPRGGRKNVKPILKIIEDTCDTRKMIVPFEQIGKTFRIIETSTESIIVPYDDKAISLIEQLRQDPDNFHITRALQRYTVQAYPNEIAKVDHAIDYSVEPYRILDDMSVYDEKVGLLVFSHADLEEYRIKH